MSRVVSKNLFNFAPKGEVDEDIRIGSIRKGKCRRGTSFFAFGASCWAFVYYLSKYVFNQSLGRILWPYSEVPCSEHQLFIEATLFMFYGTILNNAEKFVKGFRVFNNWYMELVNDHPVYKKGIEACCHSEFKVQTTHCGDYGVNVLVHVPKYLANNTDRAAVVYAHGGGVVACSAATHKPFLSTLANECGVVVFNVDYRRAPETRCPNNILDFYEVLKYVKEHATELGVDASKIAIAGESGGGYLCLGTMVLLAKQKKSHIVKLAMPSIPMTDDDIFHTWSWGNLVLRKLWRWLSHDFENEKNDALLFPGKAADNVLKNMPPTILWEAEFDLFIAENTRLANRLKSAGRLLEFVVFPGQRHGSNMNPNMKCYQMGMDAWKLAIAEYLHGEIALEGCDECNNMITSSE